LSRILASGRLARSPPVDWHNGQNVVQAVIVLSTCSLGKRLMQDENQLL
ncbi:hypothetical protein LCGC14_2537160, partial [marine sediment metagenome]